LKALTVVVLAALAAGTRSLGAQTVIQPEAKLNEAQTLVRTSLYQLRDTLLLVEAASARIARDLGNASDAALRSRAQVMTDRCRAAVVQIDTSRATVSRGGLPDPDPKTVRASLDQALGTLRGEMQHCIAQFTGLSNPAKAEELRGYGIGRGKRVLTAIRNYRPTASQYFRRTFNQQYWPNTAGAGGTPTTP
jgi:hypothetical protein